MKATMKAIRTALRADIPLAAIVTAGIYTSLRKSGQEMPSLVWNYAGGWRPDYNTGERQIERQLYRFRTFAISAVTAVDSMERIEALLGGTLLTLDSGSHMQFLKDSENLDLDPDLSEDGEEVWVSTLQMEAMVDRNPFS